MTPGAQPSHQGQCSDLPGPSASALASESQQRLRVKGQDPEGRESQHGRRRRGRKSRDWEHTKQGQGFPKLSIPSAEPVGRDSHEVIWGKVCQAEGTVSAKALRLASVLRAWRPLLPEGSVQTRLGLCCPHEGPGTGPHTQ